MNEMTNRPNANSAFRRMTVRDARLVMRDAVRLNIVVQRLDRVRAAEGLPVGQTRHHEELAEVLQQLADHGFPFDPNQYAHPNDVTDV